MPLDHGEKAVVIIAIQQFSFVTEGFIIELTSLIGEQRLWFGKGCYPLRHDSGNNTSLCLEDTTSAALNFEFCKGIN